MRNLLAERPWKKGKEQKPSESGTSEGGGQRAIRVSAPALTQVPECWVGTAPGLERTGGGARCGSEPPKACFGLLFSQESRRSLEMVWCFRTHTWTPPFHHHLAAPVAGRLLLSWRPLPKPGGVGGGSRGSLSGCPREGLGALYPKLCANPWQSSLSFSDDNRLHRCLSVMSYANECLNE